VVDLAELQDEALVLDEPLDLEQVRGETGARLLGGPVRLAGTIRPAGARFALRARLSGQLALECSRCLEPYTLPLDVSLALTLVPVAAEADPTRETDDDPSIFHALEGRVDLQAVAAEQVYLAVPLKPVCDPACRGLCPTCGCDRNRIECACHEDETDPRLAPLLELKKRMRGR
jgi:uncharacterized protein